MQKIMNESVDTYKLQIEAREALRQNLAKLRKEHNLNQKQFADAIGVSYATVHYWEGGKASPNSAYVYVVSKVFDVDANKLFESE